MLPTGQGMLVQACRLHPILKALCAHPNITPSYLKRRVKEVDPGWRMGYIITKPAFSDDNKAERVAFCKLWLNLAPNFWWQVVWVDEFTVYKKPLPHTAIHRRGELLTATDNRLHHFDFGTYGSLSLCVAVNAYMGLVGYWWIHTSEGYDGRKVYMVSVRGEGGPTLQRLQSGLQAQLLVRVGVNNEALRALQHGQSPGLAQRLSPLALVSMVQPHKHAILRPCSPVFPPVHV